METNRQAESSDDLAELLGDPQEVAELMRAFGESAEWLSAEMPHLIEKYDQRWVAVYGKQVVADAAGIQDLMQALDDRGIPRGETVVEYIRRIPRKLIL